MTGQHEAGIRHLGDGYEPHVGEGAGRLFYSLPVDSGFLSAAFSFGIRPADLAVLLSDPYRRAVLESVAHTTLQSSMPAGSKPVTEPVFAAIVASVLHAPPDALQRLHRRRGPTAQRQHRLLREAGHGQETTV